MDAVVNHLHYILARRELGDFSGVPYLEMFERAVERAGLTEVQLDVVEQRMQGLTFKGIALIQGRKENKVRLSYAIAREKIAEQLTKELAVDKP